MNWIVALFLGMFIGCVITLVAVAIMAVHEMSKHNPFG